MQGGGGGWKPGWSFIAHWWERQGLFDKSGEIPCPSSYVAGDRAGGLQQVSRSTDELPDRGGHGMAGTNHTTLWSWISPMRVAKAAPAPRACCFVKHNLPAGLSSVQSCSQIKSVVFSRCGHLFGPECNTEVLCMAKHTVPFSALAPLCCAQVLQCLFQKVTSGVPVSLCWERICFGLPSSRPKTSPLLLGPRD